MNTKTFKTRDSATTLLRKMGINPRDYNLFIEKTADNQVLCKVGMAEAHLGSLKTRTVQSPGLRNPGDVFGSALNAAKLAKAGRRAVDPVVEAPVKAKRGGISHVARELILAGKTNQEVWAILKDSFNLDDGKKHYPTWYRSELKRKGML